MRKGIDIELPPPEKWTILKSSNIQSCMYFRKTQLLLIKFKETGAVYAYCPVRWATYMKFRRASSKGSALYSIRLNKNIQFERID